MMQRDPEWDGGQHQGAGGQGDGGDQAEEQAADHHAGQNWSKTVVDSNRKTIDAQVCLLVSVPVIVYLSSQASQSMRQSSRIFDEQVFFGHRFTHTHTHRLKTWTMRSGRRTVCSNNFSLLTSLHSSKLESNPHLSTTSALDIWSPLEIRFLRIPPSHLTYDTVEVMSRMYENTTLFFGDIVGFTKLTAQR